MKKALIIQLSRFGDILQSTPLIANLKEKNYKIYILIDEKNYYLCNDIPVIDKIYPLKIGKILSYIKNNNLKSGYFELKKLIDNLKEESFNLLINLNHSEINLYISKILTKIPQKKGFKVSNNKFINFLYSIIGNSRKLNPFNLVDVFNYFIKDFSVKKIQISNKFTEDNLKLPENFIILHLGAGHPVRFLDFEIMAKFSDEFLSLYKDFFIILTGTSQELKLGEEYLKKVNNNRILNFIGKTDYYQLKSILKKSKLLISTDTGIMHLAAALNIKILALFFASAFPFETGPYTENAIIITPNLNCYPCKEFAHCKDLNCKNLINEKIILNCCNFLLQNDTIHFNNKNVIVYKPYFDKYGIFLKEISNKFDKFYKERLNNRLRGIEILNENF